MAKAGGPEVPIVDDGGEEQATSEGFLATTLLRGLAVLSCFEAGDGSISNGAIAARLGLSRPTVTRLCQTLVHAGYLRRDAQGRFRLMPRILSLAYPVLAAAEWRHRATTTMREVAVLCDGNCAIVALSGSQFVSIHSVMGTRDFPHAPEVGVSGPLLGSASGVALLSLLSQNTLEEQLTLVRDVDPIEYAREKNAFRMAIERCRQDGFAVAGTWRPTILGAVAPLGIGADGTVCALSCTVPRYRSSIEHMRTEIGPRIRDAAQSLLYSNVFGLGEPCNR